MSKRGAEKYLTDQNYNDDDAEDEEQSGSFQQASAAALATREIKKAKRRVTEQGSSPASGGAFQGFTGLAGSGGSQPAAPLFKFGADANKPFTAIASMTSSASSTTVTSAPSNSSQSMSFVAPSANAFGFGQSGARFAPSTASSVVTSASPISSTSTASSNGQKSSSVPTYRSELKMLNESVLTWIDQHVRSNPHCILSPIFVDYNRYVEELDRKYPNVDETASSNGTASTVTPPVSTTSASSAATATVSANLSTAVSSSSSVVSTVAGGGFQFGATKSTSLFSSAGTFGSAVGFGSSGTFGSFGSSSASKSSDVSSSASGSTEATATEGDDDEYIPPKPEVVEIKEDDAFYTVKCKLFYQKDKSWQDRGVGNLYLKPCSEGKTQLLVRADTNLGNILLNIMLSASIPTSRQGANNVSFACIPNPPIPGLNTSTPVPMLIRVKTGSDADALFEQLNSHKQ